MKRFVIIKVKCCHGDIEQVDRTYGDYVTETEALYHAELDAMWRSRHFLGCHQVVACDETSIDGKGFVLVDSEGMSMAAYLVLQLCQKDAR